MSGQARQWMPHKMYNCGKSLGIFPRCRFQCSDGDKQLEIMKFEGVDRQE